MKNSKSTALLPILILGFLLISWGIAVQMGTVTFPSSGRINGGSTYSVLVAADGSGDYTTIQAGLNALPLGGGEVDVKDGDYLISSEIVMSLSYVKLRAIGTNVKIYSNTPDVNIIHVRASNVEISGFYIVGEGSFQTWDGGNGILLDGVEGVTVSDVKVENAGTVGIYLRDSSNNAIIRADVSKSGKHGITLRSSSYNKVLNSTSYENGRFIGSNYIAVQYNGVASHYNLFQYDVSYNSGDNGFYIDQQCTYNTIKNSKAFNHTTIWGGGGQGMLIKASYTVIQDNEVWGSARSGIVLNEGEVPDGGVGYSNITGNYLHDNLLSGVAQVVGHDNYFAWNWAEGSQTRDGIEIEYGDNNRLEYNTMINDARTDLSIGSSYNYAANNYYTILFNGGTANNIAPSLSAPPRPHP